MIHFSEGNLLESEAEALVNTVNCVGVMGKGIALQFKQAFPKNFDIYAKACKRKEVVPGNMLVFETGSLVNPKFIINFPTKKHWKAHSRIEDIESGLEDLVKVIRELSIASVAIPPLGAGLGGLKWEDVRIRILRACKQLPNVDFYIYQPIGTPRPHDMPVRTERPRMTQSRALLVNLLGQYKLSGYRHSLLEVQKLAYFLQEAGEKLQLEFVAGKYGPYAEKLNHVLQRTEGHFTRGYGDRSVDAEIELIPSAISEAEDFLREDGDASKRLSRVKALIEGFDFPYGMELLATVHWVAKNAKQDEVNPEMILQGVQKWSPRKKRLMNARHVEKAYCRLERDEWIAASNSRS